MGPLGCVFGLGVLGCIDFSGSRLAKDGYDWNQRNKDGRNVLNLVNQRGAAQSIREKLGLGRLGFGWVVVRCGGLWRVGLGWLSGAQRLNQVIVLQVTVFFVAGGWGVCGVCIANHSYLYKL